MNFYLYLHSPAPFAYYFLKPLFYFCEYWWDVKPKVNKDFMNVLKLVDMSTTKLYDNRSFSIISREKDIFIEQYANLCIGNKCCFVISWI